MLEELFKPKKLGGILLNNFFIKSATYEGMYANGLPTKDLTDHHVSMAKGGVGLTTVSYGAVSNEGKTFKDQMHINTESLVGLKDLVNQVQQAGGKVSIQLTHCGYFSKNVTIKAPIAPSRVFNEYGCLVGLPFSRAMKEQDLNDVRDQFVQAAIGVQQIGFDAIEIHMGHGYLLSQFLSPYTNRRKDVYGGSIENRARFPLAVFKAVKEAVGKSFPVLVKLNLSDGFTGGFSEEDCLFVASKLEELGCDALVLSGGFTSKTPFYLMRGEVPLKGMIENGESLAERITMRLFGPMIVKKYDFKPNFFLNQAKRIKQKVNVPIAYLGGVDSTAGMLEIQKEGFDFIALARPLIHDSNFLLKIMSKEIEKTACNRCNECVVEMDRGGVRCVL